jgi:hypothetical protein
MKKSSTTLLRRAASGRIEVVKVGTRQDISQRVTKSLSGGFVTVRVAMTPKEMVKSTAKQLSDLLGKPISASQRDRARTLATQANDAKNSPVTAKFRRTA